MILSLIPFLQIGYYLTTWHCLTPASLLAVYMTNPEEAFGFLKNAAGIPGLIAVGIGLVIWTYLLYWSNLGMKAVVNLNTYTTYALHIAHCIHSSILSIRTILLIPENMYCSKLDCSWRLCKTNATI